MASVSGSVLADSGSRISWSGSITALSQGTRVSACSTSISGCTGYATITFNNTTGSSQSVTFTARITSDGSQVICSGNWSGTLATGSSTKGINLSNVNVFTSPIGSTSRSVYCNGSGGSNSSITLSGWSAGGGGTTSLGSISASASGTTTASITVYTLSYGCASSGTLYGTLGSSSKSASVSSTYSGSISFTGLSPNTSYSASAYLYADSKYSDTKYSSCTTYPVAPASVTVIPSEDNLIVTVNPNSSNGTASCGIEVRYRIGSGSWSSWRNIGTGSPRVSYTGVLNVGWDLTGTVEARYNGSSTSSSVSTSWVTEPEPSGCIYKAVDGKSEKMKELYASVNGKGERLRKIYVSVDGKSELVHKIR